MTILAVRVSVPAWPREQRQVRGSVACAAVDGDWRGKAGWGRALVAHRGGGRRERSDAWWTSAAVLSSRSAQLLCGGFCGAGRQIVSCKLEPPPFGMRKGFPSTGNFHNICVEEGNERFPLAEKLKLKWKMKPSQYWQ